MCRFRKSSMVVRCSEALRAALAVALLAAAFASTAAQIPSTLR